MYLTNCGSVSDYSLLRSRERETAVAGRSLRTRYCCYRVNFMGLLYLVLACILWRKLV